MAQNANNGGHQPVLSESGRDNRLHSRMLLTMIITTAVAVVWSLFYSSRPVTIGLLIGGLLAVLNHRWLQTSIQAAFAVLVEGQTPRITLTKYIVRYFIVASVAFIAYALEIASLPALLAGLCTFVVAMFVEALRETYLAIIHREEIS